MSKAVLKGRKVILFFMMIPFISIAAFSQDLPRIAVYVTGNIGDDEKSALGTVMLSSLINSGRYMGIERSSAFMAEIEKEQVTQRSGAIDDNQISELGKQFGVKYVCIAAITPAFGSYQISARIVDVETAVVAFIGQAFSPLRTGSDLTQVSNEVVKTMFGGQARQQTRQHAERPERAAPHPKPEALPKPPREPFNSTLWTGVSLDVLGAGLLLYGLVENGNVVRYDDKGQYRKADKSATNRNIAYTAGTALLLGGISIHIFF